MSLSSPSSPSTRVLVLFRGLPGVGKSTLATAVSHELGGAPLVDKDDHRDALAEVFDDEEDEQIVNDDNNNDNDNDKKQQRRQRQRNLFKEKLNEASYVAAFNAARTLFVSSGCPCVLLDSPLSRASTAERALALAEELASSGGGEDNDNDNCKIQLRFVVVVVGTSDEQLWRGRLEDRGKLLERSGSASAKHKPRTWEAVVALRERGRQGGARRRVKEEEEERGTTTFRQQMLQDLGVVDESKEPFARLWQESAASFVVDTARGGGGGKGDEGKVETTTKTAMTSAAASVIAEAVRTALSGGDSDQRSTSDVIFID